jgi:putative MATE family efflux protein
MYVLTDTAVVGHLGTESLAALALASTVLTTLVWVFNFLSYGTTVRVAVRRGRGDLAGAAADALQALWLSIGIGLVIAGALFVAARPMLLVLADDPDVVDKAAVYVRISAIGVPFQFITIAAIGYLYGIPDTKRPFVVALGANVVNLVLELVLVFGFHLGIAGSAWGTVTAQVLAAGVLAVIVVPRLRADGLHRLVVVPSVMWAVIKVGGHLVQRTAFLLAALALATATASSIGTDVLAGHQIAAQLFLFLAIAVDMFKVAGQSLVGHALGADQPAEARRVVDHLERWGWRVGTVLTLLVAVLSPVLPLLFTDDPAVIDAATTALLILALMQVPCGITFVLDGALMGANDFRNLRWQTTLAFVAALPIFVAVHLWPSLGIAGVWTALFVWMTVRAARNHSRVRGEVWMRSAATV